MNDSQTPTKAPGVRARVRAQLTAEIKESARRQLALQGASSLSLRAIARELDMASSAIYRYFASRDELLTALIIDAYESAAEQVEAADAECDRDDFAARLISVGRALREWAVANPHEYALIYGSPVPGYAAPEDTIDPAARVSVTLLTVLVERHAGTEPVSSRDTTGPLADALAGLLGFTGDAVSPEILSLGVRAWGEIFGLISLELFGHFANVVSEPGQFFDHAMVRLADQVLA